jgi:hypothetical protein
MSKKKTLAQLEAELTKTKAKLAKLKKKAIRIPNDELRIRFAGSLALEIHIDKETLVANRWNSLEHDARARLLYRLVRDEFALRIKDDATRDSFMSSVRCEDADNEDGEHLDFTEIGSMSLDRLEELGILDD